MPSLKIYPNEEILVQKTAEYIAELITRTVKERKIFTMALSGGSTPKALYARLATDLYQQSIPWNRVHFFWGDERCVPPDHPDSNYRMAREALLDLINIPMKNIHRISAEKPPEKAAVEYEKILTNNIPSENGQPRLDLILLGVGNDGHTASIFPGTKVIHEQNKLVAPTQVPSTKARRITLTYPMINRSRSILFLAKGSSKKEIIRRILVSKSHKNLYPVQKVRSEDGHVVWFLDNAAAAFV